MKRRARSVSQQYGTTAKWLHWLAALLVLAMLGAASQFAFTAPADRASDVPGHASIGLILLTLTLLRLAWRWFRPPPAPPTGTPATMVRAARTSHRLLYALILYQGAVGLIMAAYSPVAIRFFNGPNISALADGNEAVLTLLRPFHFAGAVVLAGLVVFHIAGALWHHFIRRDDVLIRMLPFGGLWQRLQAEEAKQLERFPSRRFANWPKRMPQ